MDTMKRILIKGWHLLLRSYHRLILAPRRLAWRFLGYSTGPEPSMTQAALEARVKECEKDVDTLFLTVSGNCAYIGKLKATIKEMYRG